MAKREFQHLIVKRLSAESVRAGIIDPAGLTDQELAVVIEDTKACIRSLLFWVGGEKARRERIRADRARKVVPLPGCGEPEHYHET